MKRIIFLTGATGFIGSHLLRKMLMEDNDTLIYALVRGGDDMEAKKKLQSVLMNNFPEMNYQIYDERITVLSGDITREKFGLRDEDYLRVVTTTTDIIHAAANVSYTLSIEEARGINVNGAKNAIKLAEDCNVTANLESFSFISTAYVCGNTSSVIAEEKLSKTRKFANTYEQSKFEAENLVLEKLHTLPVRIFRPSIVVGDSMTGKTTSFNVIYYPINLMRRGMLKVIAGKKSVKLDIVPINYVVESIYHIIFRNNRMSGKIFNLTAGNEKSLTLEEIFHCAQKSGISKKQAKVLFVPYKIAYFMMPFLSSKIKRFKKLMTTYEPFLSFNPCFRNDNTVAALFGSGIKVPELRNYFQKLMDYCIYSDWGKK